MIQQIVVWDENHVKIGNTFPRRAKQLVNKKKATWLNETHTEIVLLPIEKGGSEMNTEIANFANELFKDTPQNSTNHDIKEVLLASLNEKYEALITQGMDKDKAVEAVTKDVSDVTKFINSLTKEKSIVKDAYRDSASVVLRSSPLEIIKKSKRRTRELHTAFSAVLWTGAAMVYFVLNFFLGNTEFSLDVSELSWTWLVFVFAGFIECSVEIYFCRKELEVLNENIDLRQINPSKGGDLDLRSYQQKLKAKIRLMSSAVLWIPLVMIYCIGGYLFDSWNVGWIVFIFGVFFEVLQNFLKKLKENVD